MKNLLATLLMVFFTVSLWAQGTISGTVLEDGTEEALIGATVYLEGTNYGTVTDLDGKFTILDVESGDYKLIISYTGYGDLTMDVNPATNGNIGTVAMSTSSIGLQEVNVIASIAVDRKTPIAVTTISGAEVAAKVGNQEYPEILRSSPSVYVTKQGGGFGDSRINIRGFDQRNTAVMINGIPVNDMENGWVYWSNWAGLADVTSNLQVQRGLGASKLAVPSVGGSINIITNAAEMRKGTSVSVGTGNDGYQKYGLAYNTGLMDNGLAVSAMVSHTRGNGYVDGTAFQAYSYFLSASKTFNDQHTLALSAVGAPQWHHQRTVSSFDNINIGTYREKGIKYNHVWGTLNGEEFTWRKNFYHKPKVFLNHYWTLGENTDLKTSAYVSFGRGGGTGPRGRLRTPGSVFDSYSGDGRNTHDENGQVRFDDIVAYNQGQAIDGWGEAKASSADFSNQNVVTSDGRVYYDANGNLVPSFLQDSRANDGSGFIRRASMNSHNWVGLLSTLTHRLSSNLTLTGGVDGRFYKGIHYRRLENLLGADGYYSRSDVGNRVNLIQETSEAKFGNFGDPSYKDGNILNYHNDGIVTWAGLFGQVEYSSDKVTAFVSASGSNQGFKRVDYFNYEDSDAEQSTEFQNFGGGTIKGGVNFNITERSNIYANAGFISRQPIFDNVFINFRNDVNPDAKNQNIKAFEIGYGYRSSTFKANINLYNTVWDNRFEDFGGDFVSENGTIFEGRGIFEISNTHRGIEMEASWSPTKDITFSGMASFGDWVYTDDLEATVFNIDTNAPSGITNIVKADGAKVGDAAQTTVRVGVDYEFYEGLKFYGDLMFFDDLYGQFNILESTTGLKLPAYSLANAGLSYKFNLGPSEVVARFNCNNLFDTHYISELFTNRNGGVDNYNSEQGWFGAGRTWNAGLKFNF